MKARILIVLFCMTLVIVMVGCIQPEMTIYGTVTAYSSGELLEGVEVSVFTYKQPSLEYLPPLGQKIKNTSTDNQGRYELCIPRDYKGKKVVVFCHDAQEGWQVINVSETTDTEKVDLIFGAPVPKSETPPVLLKLQQTIQGVLDRMDEDLFAAAEKLSQTGLDSPETRVILAELCRKHPYVIECGTVDQNGTIVVVEPEAYKRFEGSNISQQEHIVKLHQTQQPVLSQAFRAVEGFDAVDLEWPVFSSEGNLIGLVGMLIRPESFLSTIIAPEVQGFPIDVWVMQTDGRILYDPDVEEIGRNLFEDPLYQPFTQLLSLGKKIAVESSGSGHYEFFGRGLIKEVKKRASWVTVGLHGTEWRLVVIQVVVGDSSAAKRGPPELGLISADAALRRLAQDPNLLLAMAAGDKETCLSIFRQYYEDYPGIYSIQWADASGINRFGYPEENSLTNYDIHAQRTPASEKFLAVIEAREEVSFVFPLMEGNIARCFSVPLYADGQYLG
ncbi:MAG: hypothetical protein KAT65_26275, partial [Methanophagales archaeon]|nr:hypothetical protein [Methanophagales archaeon]